MLLKALMNMMLQRQLGQSKSLLMKNYLTGILDETEEDFGQAS